MNNLFQTIAEQLLGRNLVPADGIPMPELAHTEQSLGIIIPGPLKDWYVLLGRLPLFMTSFQRIYEPDQLTLQSNKLVFMEENQGVCYWAVTVQDNNMPVYQSTCIEENKWFSEETRLAGFLTIMLYYQYAQGSPVRHTISLPAEKDKMQWIRSLDNEYKKMVNHNGLVIYAGSKDLIWYFADENGFPETDLYKTPLAQ